MQALTCTICCVKLKNYVIACNHYRSKHGRAISMCPYCKRYFTNSSVFVQHMNNAHSEVWKVMSKLKVRSGPSYCRNQFDLMLIVFSSVWRPNQLHTIKADFLHWQMGMLHRRKAISMCSQSNKWQRYACVLKSNWIGCCCCLLLRFMYSDRRHLRRDGFLISRKRQYHAIQMKLWFLVKIQSTHQSSGSFHGQWIVRKFIAADRSKVNLQPECTTARSMRKTIYCAKCATYWFRCQVRTIWFSIFIGSTPMNRYRCPFHQHPRNWHPSPQPNRLIRPRFAIRLNEQAKLMRIIFIDRKKLPGAVNT